MPQQEKIYEEKPAQITPQSKMRHGDVLTMIHQTTRLALYQQHP